MLKSTVGKVVWVGRATVFLVGLAVILAIVFGVASAAFGANGQNFILGQLNKATAITQLNGNVSGGPALRVNNNKTDGGSKALQLGVAQGKPPLVVNATAGKAKNLNADKLDGKDATKIGVNGLEIAEASSAYTSTQLKGTTAQCPPGKKVVGGGARYSTSETGISRGSDQEVAIQGSVPLFSTSDRWSAEADWMGGSGFSPFKWRVIAYAICAKAP